MFSSNLQKLLSINVFQPKEKETENNGNIIRKQRICNNKKKRKGKRNLKKRKTKRKKQVGLHKINFWKQIKRISSDFEYLELHNLEIKTKDENKKCVMNQ